MYTPIGLMFLGLALGFGLRKVSCLARVPRAITPTILLMLFVLGLAVGGNKALVANLPTLGGRALALTLAGVAGSLIGVLLIRRHFPGAGPGGRAIAAAEQKERAGSPADAAGLATAFKEAPLPPRGTASGGADDGR